MTDHDNLTAEKEVKHTPGPWELDVGAHKQEPGFYGGDEGYHSITIPGVTEITGFMGTANARIVVAAPDMLEALECLLPGLILDLRYADDDDDKDAMRSRIETVETAIRKARHGQR